MRLLLLGGTDLTVSIAEMILQSGVELGGVVYVGETFNISYSAHGMRNVRHGSMLQWCRSNSVKASEYTTNEMLIEFAKDVGADFCLVAGWYHMVPKRIRDLFPLGCAGIHASMLPDLRGGAPLNWAILLGKRETGVTLFELGDGVDDGKVYAQRTVAVGEREYISELMKRVEATTISMLKEALPSIASGHCKTKEQQGDPSYGLARIPDDGRIDWTAPAEDIERLVRAVSRPYPGAFSMLEGERFTIWRGTAFDSSIQIYGKPGQVARIPEFELVCVITGKGYLSLDEVEISGSILDRRDIIKLSNRRLQ